jgi:hypothetical protein
LEILIFQGVFMIFGFAAARALKVVLMMLLDAAAIYSVVLVQYTARFGDPKRLCGKTERNHMSRRNLVLGAKPKASTLLIGQQFPEQT